MLDWSAAFDRQCPKLGIQRFLECGVRPEIVPILVSYLSMRSMSVKLNGVCSETFQMPGGGPQGTLLGVLEYLTQSNNNADCIDQSLRFKYVDDLTILELISLNLTSTGLASYNYKLQVPSDIGAGHLYLPASNFDTQTHIETIARWTEENKMQLNEKKSNYMLISRSHTDVSTRIKLNDQTLERIHATKLLGVWITDTLDWELNTRELCKKAYVRITLLTRLKYAGAEIPDLVRIYTTFIRCLLEYCCVVWHSSLTLAQSESIERVQKTSLRIILGNEYENYQQALEHCCLEKLKSRRETLCLRFGKKCVKSAKHQHLFPLNPPVEVNLRRRELYQVNRTRTERYRSSTLPYIQSLLNSTVV